MNLQTPTCARQDNYKGFGTGRGGATLMGCGPARGTALDQRRYLRAVRPRQHVAQGKNLATVGQVARGHGGQATAAEPPGNPAGTHLGRTPRGARVYNMGRLSGPSRETVTQEKSDHGDRSVRVRPWGSRNYTAAAGFRPSCRNPGAGGQLGREPRLSTFVVRAPGLPASSRPNK